MLESGAIEFRLIWHRLFLLCISSWLLTFEKKKKLFCNCEKIFDEPANSGVTTVNVSSAMDYALAGWMFGDVLMRSPANIELQAYHKANAQAKGLNKYL